MTSTEETPIVTQERTEDSNESKEPDQKASSPTPESRKSPEVTLLNDSNISSDLEKDLNSTNDKTLSCEMCSNYETNLAKLQETEREMKEQLGAQEQLIDRYQNELSGERVHRQEMENNMRTLSAETEKEVKDTIGMNQEFVEQLDEFEKLREASVAGMREELKKSVEKYQRLEGDTIILSQRYQKLLGLNRQKAQEMREQVIDLPQTVDELQLLCLQLREELIETRAAKEHSVAELKDELTIIQEQLKDEQIERKRVEENLAREHSKVFTELEQARRQLDTLALESSSLEERERQMNELRKTISELEAKISAMQKEKKGSDQTLSEYRMKCLTLQNELDNCEQVQRDFVRLSQGLQIQLEKIRQAEQEVRWQFDEDVSYCNQCEVAFSPKRPKLHCLHCGKIFCHNCLTQTIPSGPHGRLAKVCEVCHTLLNRDSAPYFSKSSGIGNNDANNS